MSVAFLFSCAHATCAVPEAHRELFRGQEDVLTSTEGWEPGSLNLAQGFSMKFRTPLIHGDVTRLLIDLAESGDARWSRFTEKAPEALRGKLADRHERQYRLALRQRIAESLRRHPAVLHLMIHTDAVDHGGLILSTPPGADLAERFAQAWRAPLADAGLDVRQVRATDIGGLARDLAEEFPAANYAQLKLGVAQSFFLSGRPWKWEALKKTLLGTLESAAKSVAPPSAPSDSSTDLG